MTLTPEMVERERLKFEVWAHSHGYHCHRDGYGDYLYSQTRGAWEGWIGSCERLAASILPEHITSLDVEVFRVNGTATKFVRADDLRALIDTAGGGA